MSWWDDEVGVDAVIAQIRVSRVPMARFYFILAAEGVQSRTCDVHAPRLAARLHVVSQCYIVGPYVELPFSANKSAHQKFNFPILGCMLVR